MTEPLPLSLLNDYLYCPRRAALKVVEGWRSANEHTERGDIVHEHADLSGYEVAKGVTLLRAVPVFSDRLGLNGKCDIIELRPSARGPDSPSTTPPPALPPLPSPLCSLPGTVGSPYPVEFKVGKRRKWDNDDVQLCAQALCLEEMLHTAVPAGAIYHASSKRRREVAFTEELRRKTQDTAAALHALVKSDCVPPADAKPACEECSLYDICLPRLTSQPHRVAEASRDLFSATVQQRTARPPSAS